MKKNYFTLFLFFVITIVYSQEGKKDYTEAFNLVEVWLEAQKDFEQLPGLTAIVIEDQKVLWSGAFGLSNVEKISRQKHQHFAVFAPYPSYLLQSQL